jgi:hypothetical protein
MSPDQDALALVAGIERASRRSRPFFLFGLLAVVLGFVSISVYLYQDREEERAQKAVLERQVAELSATLRKARDLWPRLGGDLQVREQLRTLLGRAIGTAEALPADVAEAHSATAVQNQAKAAPVPSPQPGQRPGDASRPDQRRERPGNSM